MTMQKEYELNRKWIVDDVGETIGETNFVINSWRKPIGLPMG